MAILKGFPPSNTVTSYGCGTIGSVPESPYSDYSNQVTPREFDKRHFGKPNEDYDEYFKDADKHIVLKRIIKETTEVPPVEEKFRKIAIGWVVEENSPNTMNGYRTNPEAYCELKRQSLIADTLTKVAGLPPDLLPLHDAIFPEDEEVQDVELQVPVHKTYWWDHDVIEEEFRAKPGMWATIEEKVAYYLNKAERSKG